MTMQSQQALTLKAPRTVVVAIALLLALLGMSGTILPISPLNAVLLDVGYPLTREWAHFFLAAAPILLLLGSFSKEL